METQRSSLGNRFFASLIDYLVIGCVFMIYAYKFGEPNNEGGYTVHGLKALVPLGFWFIYLIVIEGFFGATVGHFVMGLKVVKADNSGIDFVDSIKRHLLDPIDILPFGIPAMISIKNSALNQRLGDLWAKTIVVNDKEK
jgi:uncharacterized RDD family membrane protein YckC